MRSVPRRIAIGLLATSAVCLGSGQVPAGPPSRSLEAEPPARCKSSTPTTLVAARFERNEGQFDPIVRFAVRSGHNRMFLTDDGAAILVAPPAAAERRGAAEGCAPLPSFDYSTIRMRFAGASTARAPEGVRRLEGVTNYLIGDDPSQWRTGVASFERVEYDGLYPGIDLVYYANASGELEYDLVVAPDADPSRVALAIDGADVAIAPDGSLSLDTPAGRIVQAPPVVYQETGDGRAPVAGRYQIRSDGAVGFELGGYDTALPLVIDPVIGLSSFLGGSGFDSGSAVAYDATGGLYIGGYTFSANFPGPPAHERPNADAFVAKLNADRTGFAYVTIVGGNQDDIPASLAATSAGEATLKVNTFSTNFPVHNAAQSHAGGEGDIAVLKLTPAGSQLIFSTYLGGSEFENCFTGIAVDAAGNVFVAGCTVSSDFPTLNAVQSTIGGAYDLFLTTYSAIGALRSSTFLGGSENEAAYGVGVDQLGNIYVGGLSDSTDFPVVNALDATHNGGSDGIVMKFGPGGSPLLFATFVGGSGTELVSRMRVDARGAAYGVGTTQSHDFPVVNAPQMHFGGGESDGFVFRIAPDGRSLEYSTYFGGSARESTYGVAVDALGSAFVLGETLSTNLPVNNALQPVYGGGESDIFIAKVAPEGGAFEYATYLGGSGEDFMNEADADANGNLAFAASSNSLNFPLEKPIQQTPGGQFDAALVVITDSYDLIWEPPVDDRPESPPADLKAVRSGAASPSSPARLGTPSSVTGYSVYGSAAPGVEITAANLVATLASTANQLPRVPGGRYYRVTARRNNNESPGSKEASAGAERPTISTVKLKAAKVTITGTKFVGPVVVRIDGIPFAAPALLKKASTKVVQKGTLENGQTIGQYRANHPIVIVSVQNSDGGVALRAQ